LRLRLTRTWFAAALTSVAVVVPCAAWWVAGSRAVEQEARRLVEQPRHEARLLASRLAEAVAGRLESLREVESRRPVEHYRAEHLAAGDSCACAAGEASPLAQGLSDPLARAHFQIDEVGRLTVPAAPVETTRDAGAGWTADQRRALEELECAAIDAGAAEPGREPTAMRREETILVGPFRWRTVSLEGASGLIATREVRAGGAVLTQGFLVSRIDLERMLEGAPYPVRLRAGAPSVATAAVVPIEGARWHVEVDAADAVAAAERRALVERHEFRRSFAAIAAAALLAGGCVVGLIRQSERTASQRARFAAVAAHELRTPLAGLKMYGELLGESLGDPARRSDYARRVVTESERLGQVVDNVLGLTELERGRLSVRPRPADLGSAVEGAVHQLRPALESRGVELSVVVDEGPVQAVFDPEALPRMLHNLLDNAEKYTRGCSDRRVEVRVAREEDRAVALVRDFGAGVPRRLRRHIFRAFVRSGAAADPSGLGIGLAVVRELAVAQGARLEHRVPRDGGACFSIAFRAA